MTSDFSVNMNEYLPLARRCVQHTASGDPERRTETGREIDGDRPG